VKVPPECDSGHVYHLFPVMSGERAALQEHLRAHGVETLIHYPVPITRQPALSDQRPAECPVADRVCSEVFSLPLYPAMPAGAVEEVAAALQAFPAPV
jgi:dTDP-4-amino-4,6-dideoxygalactose transaminase